MPTLAQNPSAHIEVVPAAPEQESILASLLELYAHDFSEFHDVQLDADGRFGYQQLPLYWSEHDRYPLLVKVNGRLAGFALVKKGAEVAGEGAWNLAEFFIVRGYRRQGIGTAAAHQVWRRFPGFWEVRVMERNQAGLHFWPRVIGTFGGEPVKPSRIKKDGHYWRVFVFKSKPDRF